jgi:hypothetical protein
MAVSIGFFAMILQQLLLHECGAKVGIALLNYAHDPLTIRVCARRVRVSEFLGGQACFT